MGAGKPLSWLVINEVSTNGAGPGGAAANPASCSDAWVELLNTGSAPFPLAGLYLSDDGSSYGAAFLAPYMTDLTGCGTLAPGQYLVSFLWSIKPSAHIICISISDIACIYRELV